MYSVGRCVPQTAVDSGLRFFEAPTKNLNPRPYALPVTIALHCNQAAQNYTSKPGILQPKS